MSDALSNLIGALANGSVRIVDLTQPLEESTPVIDLPPPFAPSPGVSIETPGAMTRQARPGTGTSCVSASTQELISTPPFTG
jgi:hypothetical protein